MHIIIVCGSDEAGNREVLKRVDKALSHGKSGKRIWINGVNPIHVLPTNQGVKVGIATKITKLDITYLLAKPQGFNVLICSARTSKTAWHYCDLIKQVQGEYTVFLKRKEPQRDGPTIDDMLCRRILCVV